MPSNPLPTDAEVDILAVLWRLGPATVREVHVAVGERRVGIIAAMANQPGKRLACSECGGEVVVTKGGDGTAQCCGKPMELKA